uniref:SH3 domain-containing protein n=1 Tax=Ditylenchus dipsaci TaxID=166011 RepID=A0A915ELJ3_9BILA
MLSPTLPQSSQLQPRLIALHQRLANQTGHVVYSSESGGRRVPTEQRQVGSIADYDPLNGDWGTSAASKNAEKIASAAAQREQQQAAAAAVAAEAQQKQTTATQKNSSSRHLRRNLRLVIKALYDYTAADKDEVSFKENDIIVNCAKVDEDG